MVSKKEWGAVVFNPGCKLNCPFCGNTPKRSPQEIKKQELDVLKNLIDLKKSGLKQLEISGSDPIEYKNIASFIKYAKSVGFEYIQLSTHGCKLADKAFLKDLINSGLDKLRVPIYGSNAKIHDTITKLPGSFHSITTGIRNLKSQSNIYLQMTTLIMQPNKNDLVNMVKYVKNLGADNFYFSTPCLADHNDPYDDYSFYVPLKDLPSHIEKVFKYICGIKFPVFFMEIPFCIFGKINNSINNTSLPPNLGKYCQPPKQHKTKIKDLPAYRLKTKFEMCKKCKADNICDGFFVNDIKKFSTGDIRPII